jgi:hypothetical protein
MQRRGYQAPDPTAQAQKQEQLERSGTGCAWPRARRRRRQINLLEVKTWLSMLDSTISDNSSPRPAAGQNRVQNFQREENDFIPKGFGMVAAVGLEPTTYGP